MFTHDEIKAVVEKVSALLGLPRNSIFPVKNYESEIDLDIDVDILALMALRQMLYLAEDCTDNMLMNVANQGIHSSTEDIPAKEQTFGYGNQSEKQSSKSKSRHRYDQDNKEFQTLDSETG